VTVDNQRFEVVSDYQPAGDQPRAISQLAEGIERGDRFQTSSSLKIVLSTL